MTVTINCVIKCENGQAPAEDTIDAMLRQLKAYAEAKYSKLVKTEERQYWVRISSQDKDFHFAIYWDLEDESSSRTSAAATVVETAKHG